MLYRRIQQSSKILSGLGSQMQLVSGRNLLSSVLAVIWLKEGIKPYKNVILAEPTQTGLLPKLKAQGKNEFWI